MFSFAPTLLLPAQAPSSTQDLNEILFWGGVLVFAMLVLFVVQKVIRHVIQARVHSIHAQSGIHHEDLDRMERTGLLSEEERKKVQEAIVRNLTRDAREAAESELRRHAEATRAKSDSLTPEAIRKAVEEENARRGRLAPPQPTALPGESAFLDLSPPNEPSALPPPRQPRPSVDLDALLARGLITPEEYERLREGENEPS